MVASLAGLRLLLMILLCCGIRLGSCEQAALPVVRLLPQDPSGRVRMKEGTVRAPPGVFKLRLFASDVRNRTWPGLAFAGGSENSNQDPCRDEAGRRQAAFQVKEPFAADEDCSCSGLLTVEVRTGGDGENLSFHLCAESGGEWSSWGPDRLCVESGGECSYGGLRVEPPPPEHIPAWGMAVLVPLLVLACGLLRTVHLSLLWLDPVELYVLHSCGSEEEKRAAKRLEPVRRRGNFMACSLLFLCVLGHSALAALLFRALGSVASAAFAAASALFVVGELLPHIVSSGYGFRLAPGLTWLAQVGMVLTCPLSCPLGLILDLVLRRDISTCCIRERAMEMIRTSVNDPYSEFVKEEFSRGTLRSKTVEDILTPLKDCFMLPSSTLLDFSTMSDIMQSGYTRVPIYEEERSNIVEILYVKDLALVDPEDCTPMTTITKFYNHPLHFVFNDTKLDAMLEEFKKGNSHMAIVQKVNNEGEGDPFYEVLGLVTLEDVIEEIIKSEILDESDGYLDRKVKRQLPPLEIPLEPRGTPEEFSLFKTPEGEPKIRTSPQLLLATHRFLSREVEHFSPLRVSEKILFHLLRHPSVNQEVHFDPANRLSPAHYLYTRNHPVDYFILLLQGRVEVEIGKEGLKFDNGAFTYYGVSALTLPSSVHQSPVASQRQSPRDPFEASDATSPSSYCPDYTVRALTDLQLIRVTRLQYLNALMASRGGADCGSGPEPPEIKILPNSHTKLLNDRNAASGAPDLNFSFFDTIDNYC
ncbi:metal transporter CNNM3 isoform X2 [Corythoichthys intestinalis]|uniref:metal transporter CNNM3 isoform X2 n=1 Tax=Corythoichthys intestinalis TaxID=161448 RepID=UPI0025A50BB6|nr:metal transporter CNNM3 isoform X2 [Corythoichthys intestinalis]XP_061800138.1 metal transporter CNNM3-like [Nerophis lumbriciformis]